MATWHSDLDSASYRDVRRQVAALRGFYIHLLVFVSVMVLLVVINVLTSPVWWVQWPLLGWGTGVVIQGLGVYRVVQLFGADWEHRQIERILARRRRDAP